MGTLQKNSVEANCAGGVVSTMLGTLQEIALPQAREPFIEYLRDAYVFDPETPKPDPVRSQGFG